MENVRHSRLVPFPSRPEGRSEIFDGSHKLGHIAEAIYQIKDENKELCLNNSKVRYLGSCYIDGDLGQIFGDMGNVIFSALCIAQIVKPALAASASFLWTSCILGSLGGVLNIGVGLYCLKSAHQMYINMTPEGKQYIKEHGVLLSFINYLKGDAPEDVQKYCRMLCDGICMIGIGSLMTVISLALKIPALGEIGIFLAANPWILPLLWFIVTIPLLTEVARGNKKIWEGTDLASALQLDELKKSNKLPQDWFNADASETNPLKKMLVDATDEAYFEHENSIMQMLETSIGVEAAIEAMHLRAMLLLGAPAEEIQEQIEKLEAQIAEWNRSQRCKLLQQSLLITSFVFSILGLSPKIPEEAIGIAINGVILLGNLIPLWMDIVWAFMRNCPIVVPNEKVLEGQALSLPLSELAVRWHIQKANTKTA